MKSAYVSDSWLLQHKLSECTGHSVTTSGVALLRHLYSRLRDGK